MTMHDSSNSLCSLSTKRFVTTPRTNFSWNTLHQNMLSVEIKYFINDFCAGIT